MAMKLKIAKFKTIENLELSIPVEIKGGNGLGKSTILEAISFALTWKNLDGKEFDQVYDNRVDIHNAIADVSYFDNYGNEYQRIVKPIFQTGRDGIESIKIKRSTECRKNGIVCNDFSDEFQDFYKFGTDYFFNQKEDVQRSIFIDILKSKLPDYDVNASLLKLKELKKSQKIEVDEVKNLNSAIKNTKDVGVPAISPELEKLNNEYLSLLQVDNSEKIAEINKLNNSAMDTYFKSKSEINKNISEVENEILKTKSSIERSEELLENAKNAQFEPTGLENCSELEAKVLTLTSRLKGLEYFETIEQYAAKYFTKNPVCVENQNKIIAINDRIFVPSGEISGACPLSGEICETARLHSENASRSIFETSNSTEISTLRAQNRAILEKEMLSINSEYNVIKSDLAESERKLNNEIESNKRIEADNEHLRKIFESENKKAISDYSELSILLIDRLKALNEVLSEYKSELAKIKEPTPEKLPEALEISDELKEAHANYIAIEKEVTGANAINANNAKITIERTAEVKAKQANLFQIGEQISTLTTEISDYFSNLSGIVKSEFSGEIEIDVQLLEFVMSRDEYKDCFKITANWKVFPYECNGALQNNVKLQILANMQRLKGYTGITVMDNCESNTTTPINTCGLNCVLAYATNDNTLKIK